MRRISKVLVGVLFFIGLVCPPKAEAFIVINEFLSDPASDLSGDSNQDGVRSGTNDEFIEILNFSDAAVDISGWSLTDAVSTRHIFSATTVLSSFEYLVLFGGGSPNLPGIDWQVASSGSLGLNNGGDTISLFDSDLILIDQVPYGSLGGRDQSLARFPEGAGIDFVLHSSISEAQGRLFSPGESIDGQPLMDTSNMVVPEPASAAYFVVSGIAWFLRRRMI